jgi:SAM-dependent methyltransferase
MSTPDRPDRPGAEEPPVAEHPTPGRVGSYGIDAPYVPAMFVAGGVAFLVLGFVSSVPAIMHTIALVFLLEAGIYLHTTLRGKFVAWDGLLDALDLRGDEQIADLGCGRGAVLVAAAKRLPDGRAHGVDLWRSQDQSGNAEEVTARNAQLEGVSSRIELHTGDLVDLPLVDSSVDVVVSSLAIHNIPSAAGRTKAIDEALRILRPGGRLVIVDIKHVREHAQHLTAAGASEVAQRSLGPGLWFGGPWVAGSVVTANKPA